ncbi:MAG TPA: YeeE/YedE thiosulfate transporter family protein [Anaerolineales bacterium]|nr:YeeE/YedE thiosulfate transporter family protein [Anaerolineales bacterium]
MNQIKAFVTQKTWSPYLAGILLGIVGLLTVLLANTLLGASGAFESIVGLIGKKIAPSLFSNVYWGVEGGRAMPVIRPEITWSVILLVGIFFGGTLAAFSSHTFKFRFNDDAQWKRIIGPQPWKRWVIGFVGAIIVEYGAGIAGGCTSGLAISGGMLFVPAAFLFMAGFMITGVITALIVYRKRY